MHRIEIKNFFAISHASIEIGEVVLLIGAQASGKSTISKLIYFFKSIRNELLTAIYRYIADPVVDQIDTSMIREQFWSEIRRKFIRYFGSTRHLRDFEIVYSYDGDKKITISLHPDRRLKVEANAQLFNKIFRNELPELLRQALEHRPKANNIYGQIGFSDVLREIENKVNEIFDDNRVPHFIPASRNITVSFPDQLKLVFFGSLSGDISLIERDSTESKISKPSSMSVDLYLMSEFMRHVEGIKERFRNSDFEQIEPNTNVDDKHQYANEQALIRIKQILRADYRLDRYGEKLYYNEEDYVDLNDASSGQQEAIRILQDTFLILLDRVHAFRVLEEPEAHLYPLAQKALLELIAIMLNQTNSQIVITTHSPYVLSVLNNLLYASHVVRLDENLRDEVSEVLPQICWLQAETFNAYTLRDGKAYSIVDKKLGLIDQNALDEISDELGAEFSQMYKLRAKVVA